MNNQVSNKIHEVIKQVWLNDIQKDYENCILLKEDTLKNAFYFHIRRRLGDNFLKENNLAIFTEYYLKSTKQKVDLAIVEISEDIAGKHLSECVINIISIIEMKHKNIYANESVFEDDVDKVISYTKSIPFSDTRYYLAFIREVPFHPEDVEGWLENTEKEYLEGKITELLSYGCLLENKMIWRVIEN